MIQSPELTDAYVLCQDCGHAEPYSDAKHFGDEFCPKCGGDYCGCNACSGIARFSVQFQAQAKRRPQRSGQRHLCRAGQGPRPRLVRTRFTVRSNGGTGEAHP